LTKRRAHQLVPCENCPYRKDAPRRYWSAQEFKDLLAHEDSTLGSLYACHKEQQLDVKDRGVCAGWLLDQKKRDLPSIRLRLLLSQDESAADAYRKVSDGGHEMFSTFKAMCRANGVRSGSRK
jgi:Family of unknown function (DUF6283)